jgi:hypothetical protein
LQSDYATILQFINKSVTINGTNVDHNPVWLLVRKRMKQMVAEHQVACLRSATKQPPPSRRVAPREALIDELENVVGFLRPQQLDGKSMHHSAPNLEAALDMVNRAAEVMGMLERRVLEMKTEGQAQIEQAKRDFGIAEAKAASFKQLALNSEVRADDLEARLRQAERRLAQADELEARLKEADQRAREADEWLARFYDTIAAAFTARPATVPRSSAA